MKIDATEMVLDMPPRVKFRNHIQDNCFSNRLVAIKIGIEPAYLSNICAGKLPLTKNVRQKLNQFFETDY